jgi:DNA-binding response OmpR family regulator
MLRAARYDVMVLDMRLPGLDGIEVMRAARQIQADLIILVLTGHATLQSAITAVKAGASDYLLKPIGTQGIIDAIRAALQKQQAHARRQQLIQTAIEALRAAESIAPTTDSAAPPRSETTATPSERFRQIGTLILDRVKRLVTFEDDLARLVALTEGEAQILECLMDAADQPLACRQIAQRVWNYDLGEVEAESLVRPYIFRLRQKIERNPQQPALIQTVRGRGYLLATTSRR